MRLSLKLGFVTALGIVVILTVYGALRVQRESAAFESDVRRDHDALGRAVALLASAAAERGGVEHALELIQDADSGQQNVVIGFVPEPQAELESGVHSEIEVRDGRRALVTRVRAEVGGPGNIELVEVLNDEDAYVAETLKRTAIMTLSLIGFSCAIIFGAGWILVGRPLRLLVAKARRIGDGDLTGPLELRQHDEIGELAREINAMCERLANANNRVLGESRAREGALEQLRHAERLATVGKLAAGIAHELGTPLNVAGARAKMIARGESRQDEVAHESEVIYQQVERMTAIIRQLLDYARPRPPQRSASDLEALIDSTIGLLASTAAKAHVRLRNLARGQCRAQVDVMQLQQVLANLTMNAIHAQPGGGEVRMWAQREADGVSLFVEDDGSGIPDELRQRVFEPFFTTKDPGQGTGLGLSVARGIVEEHGGCILAEKAPGGGTRMHIRLPT